MDFFQQQERARRKTGLLAVYFLAAVVLIIVAIYLAVAGVLLYGHRGAQGGPAPTLWVPDAFVAVALGTVLLISLGSLYKILELSGGGEAVARSLGGRPVSPNTTDLRERVLLNVVEEMAIASGTPVPPVYLLEGESAINAFAAGTTPQNAVIGITRGTIETFSRDELQGVIAHEFSHILNGDMRLNIRLIGTLNGILLIAMAGYVLMRFSSNSSSSSDDKKGGNPLPILGLCLFVIGYIGVFFGHLIKSAVSRQREFLADASAVQFTRFPQGIAGALKKIGGFSRGSKLQSPKAEEASHMYFGNGLTAPFFQLLATHPPLAERIRRIDPTFDGQFPPVSQIQYSPDDVVDPNSLAARRAAAAPEVPLNAGATIALQSAAAVAQIGAPGPAHLDYAAKIVQSLPADLARNVRDPLGAVATIYALLLDDEDATVRQRQLDYLSAHGGPGANQETLRLAPSAASLAAAARLPLVSLTLPALRHLSPKQLAVFRDNAEWLIKADNKVSLFEYAVHRLVLCRLLPNLEHQPSQSVKYNQLTPLVPACAGLLSTLAHLGARDDSMALRAFRAGTEKLGPDADRLELLPRDQTSLKLIDAALDQFGAAAPAIKKRVIEACAACIAADGRVTVEEAEFLRVVSDALECPMPPLLDSASTRLQGQ